MILRMLGILFATVILTSSSYPRTAAFQSRDSELEKDVLGENLFDNGPVSRGRLMSTAEGSSIKSSLQPFMLEIQTVPPLEGITFVVAGRRLITNAQGTAQTQVWREARMELEVRLDQYRSQDLRLEFARWGDPVFTQRREIELAGSTTLEAGFHLSYPINLGYVDLEGNAVPAERITSVELRSSKGDVVYMEGNHLQWLQAIEVLGRDFGLDPVEVVYTVQRVVVNGSNVVNRGQQRFTIEPGVRPQIELLLYPVQFSSRDALFGFPTGRGVRLTHPDGSQEVLPLNQEGELELRNLARGTYRSSVEGAPGLAIPVTFVVSRAQQVELIVISLVDLLVVSISAVLVLVGLLVIGRPRVRDRMMTGLPRFNPPDRSGGPSEGGDPQ